MDDGYSVTNFEHPSWSELIGKVENGVRFIAIKNGIDSANQQENDFTPFLNIINEWYAKDTSKKIRAVIKKPANIFVLIHPMAT